MSLIFFDLETTDKEPCGQILNFSFIRTDKDFNFEDELSADIRLSVLQIPTAGALLTNRVKILDHQEQTALNEPQAMQEIVKFISNSIQISKEPVILIGFNSARFDLGYLRTSLIRNGLNPYFSGKIKYHDILFLVRKAFLSSDKFPFPVNDNKLSLSLEAVSKALGLLQGTQSHHSRDDVLLSIELCKILKSDFGLDPSCYKAYEPLGTVCYQLTPNYDSDSANRVSSKPICLINENYRSALWLDLNRYAEGQGRAAISWFTKVGHQLAASELVPDTQMKELIIKAKDEFKNLTVDNFFSPSSCDIEQDIYRLDMQMISALNSFIWGSDKSIIAKTNNADCTTLASRYWLAYGVLPGKRKDNWLGKLKEYAEYRYNSGTFQLAKNVDPDSENKQQYYHPKLSEILAETDKLLEEKSEQGDLDILKQLKDYILGSEIYRALSSS